MSKAFIDLIYPRNCIINSYDANRHGYVVGKMCRIYIKNLNIIAGWQYDNVVKTKFKCIISA